MKFDPVSSERYSVGVNELGINEKSVQVWKVSMRHFNGEKIVYNN